jgi:hypothetical protein
MGNMKFLILKKGKETVYLTNEGPSSRYKTPYLEITADDIDGDFGPGDIIGDPAQGCTGSGVVFAWASKPERTKEEIAFAHRFLCQWPEGPQITQI